MQTHTDELFRVFSGDSWYGPSFWKTLDGVSAAEASIRAVATAHSIWEIVLHVEAWTREVSRRLLGGKPGEPQMGDWPETPEPSRENWDRSRESLQEAHRALLIQLSAFPESRLDELVGEDRDPELGTGMTYSGMLNGLAQHYAYHAGQIMLLRRAGGL